MNLAETERAALADALLAVGPSAPTLCRGWDAHDLAAHLWARENGLSAMFRAALTRGNPMEDAWRKARRRPFEDLVREFREGPQGASPFRLPGMDGLTNTVEYFVHHEDVRRAGPDPAPPRTLSEGEEKQLRRALKRMSRLMFRKVPFGVDLTDSDGSVIAVGRNRKVGVTGAIGELVLFASGRVANAHVRIDGKPEDEATLTASLGL